MGALRLDFVPEVLDLGKHYGVTGGPRWKTVIVNLGNGGEQRNSQRALPLGRWDLGSRKVHEKESAPINYISDWFNKREGRKEGFLFRDWTDYKVDELLFDGSVTGNTVPLYKTYRVGEAYYKRPMLFIDRDSFVLEYRTAEGVVSDGPSYTLSSGQSQLEVSLGGRNESRDGELYVKFEFFVLVWFAVDEISITLEGREGNRRIFDVGAITIEEGHRGVAPIPVIRSGETDEVFPVGRYPGLVESETYGTNLIVTDNGHRWSENYMGKRRAVSAPDFVIRQSELDILLRYFYVFRGRAGAFMAHYQGADIRSRFTSDELVLEYLYDGFYQTNGLGIIEVFPLTLLLLERGPTRFEFQAFEDTNGVLYHLGTLSTSRYINPVSIDNANIVRGYINQPYKSSDPGFLNTPNLSQRIYIYEYDFPGRTNDNPNFRSLGHSANISNSWFALDFRTYQLQVTDFVILARGDNDSVISHWVLEASENVVDLSIETINSSEWNIIYDGDLVALTTSQWHRFSVVDLTYYQWIRWRHTGRNSNGTWWAAFHEWEFYGNLREI